jgi:hypothetical protein
MNKGEEEQHIFTSKKPGNPIANKGGESKITDFS